MKSYVSRNEKSIFQTMYFDLRNVDLWVCPNSNFVQFSAAKNLTWANLESFYSKSPTNAFSFSNLLELSLAVCILLQG